MHDDDLAMIDTDRATNDDDPAMSDDDRATNDDDLAMNDDDRAMNDDGRAMDVDHSCNALEILTNYAILKNQHQIPTIT